MKKHLLFALLAGITLAAGAQNAFTGSYRITGTTAQGANGDTILLQNRKANTTQIALLKDGKFTFEGTVQDTLPTCYISYHFSGNGARLMSTRLLLEPGEIKVDVDNDARISGAPCNEAISTLYDSIKVFVASNNQYEKIVRSATSTDEEKKNAQAKLDELKKQYPQIIRYFVLKNSTSPVAPMLLAQFASIFDEAALKEIIAALPQTAQNNPQLLRIKANMVAKEQTAEGKKFTDFSQAAPDGSLIKLSDIVAKNKYTLVDFWASWCGPCRGEMPNVVEAYKKYHDKGFEILGVSLDSKAEAWTGAIKTLGITWPQVSDVKGWDNAAAALYAVRAIPATLLIAQDGTILARDLRGEELQAKLAELFK